jgi:hypothetical protein
MNYRVNFRSKNILRFNWKRALVLFMFLGGVFNFSISYAESGNEPNKNSDIQSIIRSVKVVTKKEWTKILWESELNSHIDLTKLAAKLSNESNISIQSKAFYDFATKAVQSSVLAAYVSERNTEKEKASWIESKKHISDIEVQLKSLGITQIVFDDSKKNLEFSTGFSTRQAKIEKTIATNSAINIIGIVPGLTTEMDLGYILPEEGFVIGGYTFTCIDSYGSDGTLDELLCPFGKKYKTVDITKSTNTVASNELVYFTLRDGFENKLGSPLIKDSLAQTGLGVEHQREISIWTDQHGNELKIMSISLSVDEGLLVLTSGKKSQIDKLEENKSDKMRKF